MMSALSTYIDQGSWLNHFDEKEKGHVLSFLYNMLKWLERDKADELRLMPKEFVWSKQGEIVGRFPITTPEPTPSFHEMLLRILAHDREVQKHLQVASDDKLTFSFKA